MDIFSSSLESMSIMYVCTYRSFGRGEWHSLLSYIALSYQLCCQCSWSPPINGHRLWVLQTGFCFYSWLQMVQVISPSKAEIYMYMLMCVKRGSSKTEVTCTHYMYLWNTWLCMWILLSTLHTGERPLPSAASHKSMGTSTLVQSAATSLFSTWWPLPSAQRSSTGTRQQHCKWMDGLFAWSRNMCMPEIYASM